ncbi:hypothetical protein [Pontibacter sp. G13]|uniref:hypothetical protein n=1 Tax=Pontibacter sp. G13 TaxID=3074898 RepID=UPI00288C1E0D|nr:hypothetical protein [Pontibacter sp. G13]WNJ16476.1 hypothetical protein RJD25_16545 [Pontibacter sp. G13]
MQVLIVTQVYFLHLMRVNSGDACLFQLNASMYARKASKLVNCLSQKERSQFSIWLRSEYTDRQRPVMILYECILARKSIQHIWPMLFPDEAFPEKPFMNPRFRKWESMLISSVEDFMASNSLLQDPNNRDIFLIRELRKRAEEDLFVSEFRKIQKRLAKREKRNGNYYRAIYEQQREWRRFQLARQMSTQTKDMAKIDQALDSWWIHEKLESINGLIGHSPNSLTEISIRPLEMTLDSIPNAQEMPLVELQKRFLKAFKNPLLDEETCNGLTQQLFEIRDQLQRDTFEELFGQMILLHEHFLWNQPIVLQDQLAKIFGWLSYGWHQTIFQKEQINPCGLLLRYLMYSWQMDINPKEQQEWKEWFQRISPSHRPEFRRFCRALEAFQNRDFAKAITLFSKRFPWPEYEISARVYLLKSRLALGYQSPIPDEIRNVRLLITRSSSLSLVQMQAWLNQIHLLESIFRTQILDEWVDLVSEYRKVLPRIPCQWIESHFPDSN